MPKKGTKKLIGQDFTINDSANAPKPVTRLRKSALAETPTPEVSWDQIADDDCDIIEEVDANGIKSFVYKKKNNELKSDPEQESVSNGTGFVYPEIVWYLISKYIKPEDVGRFAGINKGTYAITKRESFWRTLYKQYCEFNPKLPERLKIENSFKFYGLRQRVIRALYHTYDVFIKKVTEQSAHDSRPHLLVRRRCVNVWYFKGPSYWVVYFKFKTIYPFQKVKTSLGLDFIEELSRIDANPEEESQVLQITCQRFYEVPPLMGLTLSSVSVVLSQGFRHHRIHLGFNSGSHNISKNILPEFSVVLDSVVNISVFDWWHPNYPHFDNRLPSSIEDVQSTPLLKHDFFKTCDIDL